MITDKDTIKCEAVFNELRTHRYLWKRVWNRDKPLAAVIMLNPCMADTLTMDTTTFLVVNNVARLDQFGGVVIVNLYSRLTSKLSFRWNSDEDLNDPENDSYIRKAAAEAETVILAWGRGQDTNQRIADRVNAVLRLLDGSKEKLRVISDGERSGIHPLTPSVRSCWELEPFVEPEAIGPAARRAAEAGATDSRRDAASAQAGGTASTDETSAR